VLSLIDPEGVQCRCVCKQAFGPAFVILVVQYFQLNLSMRQLITHLASRIPAISSCMYLLVGINKPLSCRVVLAGSSSQKARSLIHNWSAALAEARADSDRSRVYLSQPPSRVAASCLQPLPPRFQTRICTDYFV
jgi:hypothetical protein